MATFADEAPEPLEAGGELFGVALGAARMRKPFPGLGVFCGTVTAWTGQYFRVTYDDGDAEEMDAATLAPLLDAAPAALCAKLGLLPPEAAAAAAEEEEGGAAPSLAEAAAAGGGGMTRSARTASTICNFTKIVESPPDEQCEFFLKSFIFALGDKWKDVPRLKEAFTKHAKSTGPDAAHMNHIQAADFLQHHGKTRTGLQRKTELEDIDLNNDGQILSLIHI